MSSIAFDDALGWTRGLLQARLLSELFADRLTAFVLKGGMAMRARDHMARATQDIDLDADQDLEVSAMQNLVRRGIRRALSCGLLEDVEITEPKQTDTTARWRIRGTDPRTRQDLTLTIEVSRRDSIEAQFVDTMPYSADTGEHERPIQVYSAPMLAFKKVKALMADNREAPRDIVDLYLLIRAQVEPPRKLMAAWMADRDPALTIARLWQKLESMDETTFRAQVLPSLPAGEQAHRLYGDWDAIRLEVGQHLQGWMEAATRAKGPSTSPAISGAPA